MIKCEICNVEFINNSGGQLTNHLKRNHNTSLEDYIILTKYGGIEPKCGCGLCSERPVFYRGEFRKYAKGHDNFDEQKRRYLEIKGNPKCQNEGCLNNVNFYRGKPQKYCSLSCSGDNAGFSLLKTQENIKKIINQKYNVDNVSQLKLVREKISNNTSKNWISNKKERLEKYHKTIIDKGCDYFFKNISKKYKETELYYQSSLEFKFLEFCDEKNILDKISNGKRVKLINEEYGYYYLPDFIYDDRYVIELKSTWIKNIQGGDKVIEIKKLSVERDGYEFICLMNGDLEDFQKII